MVFPVNDRVAIPVEVCSFVGKFEEVIAGEGPGLPESGFDLIAEESQPPPESHVLPIWRAGGRLDDCGGSNFVKEHFEIAPAEGDFGDAW